MPGNQWIITSKKYCSKGGVLHEGSDFSASSYAVCSFCYCLLLTACILLTKFI